MPRPPLIHFRGALFHITARGNNQERVFLNFRDYQRHFARVGEIKKKFPFKLYAYCFMPNHVHFLIEVVKIPISKIMQALQTGYAMYFNKKYNHAGHVFQGRYFWFLVEKENYLLELIRYIHLNPVRAKLVAEPEEYQWSSYQEFINPKKECLVEREEVLRYFSQDSARALNKFKEFIRGGIEVEREDIFSGIARGQFLGSDKFVKKIERVSLK